MSMTPERLDAIRADVADVEWRAGRIATWRAMPHPFAVESGLRTQGLRASRLAADLRDLLAEVERLQAEVERLQAAAYRAGQEAMRERCVALCRTRLQGHLQRMLEATDDCTHDQALGMADEAEECADAIRALEVEP